MGRAVDWCQRGLGSVLVWSEVSILECVVGVCSMWMDEGVVRLCVRDV